MQPGLIETIAAVSCRFAKKACRKNDSGSTILRPAAAKPTELFRCPIRIYYEDTDVSGVVYHANYLRFFERARTEWLRALGYSQERLRLDFGIAFTVADLSIQYRQPARLDDALIATLAIAEKRRVSMTFAQMLIDSADNMRVLSVASVRVVCVDAQTFKLRPLPDALNTTQPVGFSAVPISAVHDVQKN